MKGDPCGQLFHREPPLISCDRRGCAFPCADTAWAPPSVAAPEAWSDAAVTAPVDASLAIRARSVCGLMRACEPRRTDRRSGLARGQGVRWRRIMSSSGSMTAGTDGTAGEGAADAAAGAMACAAGGSGVARDSGMRGRRMERCGGASRGGRSGRSRSRRPATPATCADARDGARPSHAQCAGREVERAAMSIRRPSPRGRAIDHRRELADVAGHE